MRQTCLSAGQLSSFRPFLPLQFLAFRPSGNLVWVAKRHPANFVVATWSDRVLFWFQGKLEETGRGDSTEHTNNTKKTVSVQYFLTLLVAFKWNNAHLHHQVQENATLKAFSRCYRYLRIIKTFAPDLKKAWSENISTAGYKIMWRYMTSALSLFMKDLVFDILVGNGILPPLDSLNFLRILGVFPPICYLLAKLSECREDKHIRDVTHFSNQNVCRLLLWNSSKQLIPGGTVEALVCLK